MILSDSELVEMLREPRTRREGFAVLVKQYSEKLYWKVRRIVLSHEDANDVLHNNYVLVELHVEVANLIKNIDIPNNLLKN